MLGRLRQQKPKPLRAQLASRVTRALRENDFDAPIVRQVVAQFHRIYYRSGPQTWKNTYWRGVRVLKCPLDLWIYQEILNEVRPDVIVEAGTSHGGSAYYLASICDLLDHGAVVTIDITARTDRPQHPRITYLTGSSTDPALAAQVDERISADTTVMVILDSNHSREHVLQELELWHSRVTVGSYVVVEDTNIHGHPLTAPTSHGPGPWEAVDEWLPNHPGFRPDESREKFLLTFNPRGFLRRVE